MLDHQVGPTLKFSSPTTWSNLPSINVILSKLVIYTLAERMVPRVKNWTIGKDGSQLFRF